MLETLEISIETVLTYITGTLHTAIDFRLSEINLRF
jgi:hypothetical protein